MTPDIHHPVDWTGGADETPWGAGPDHQAGSGTEHLTAAEPDGHQGPDLLGFLCDFRTASCQEADTTTEGSERAHRRSERAAGPEEPDDETVSDADDPYAGRDNPVAADWWLASDGRWYPPELHPDVDAEPPAEPEIEERPAAAASVTVEGPARPRRRPPWSRRLLARSPMPLTC